MKHGLLIAVGGAAIVVVGLAGCSNNKSGTSSTTPSEAATPASTSATPGAMNAKVTIDGQDQNVGSVGCEVRGGKVTINIGDALTGTVTSFPPSITPRFRVVLSDANPPVVQSVDLGNVNGVTLGYTPGAPNQNAEATKDGGSYHITGTATGVNIANPQQPVNKPFEIDVNCEVHIGS